MDINQLIDKKILDDYFDCLSDCYLDIDNNQKIISINGDDDSYSITGYYNNGNCYVSVNGFIFDDNNKNLITDFLQVLKQWR